MHFVSITSVTADTINDDRRRDGGEGRLAVDGSIWLRIFGGDRR